MPPQQPTNTPKLPTGGRPVAKYSIIAGSVLLVLMVTATVVLLALSRTQEEPETEKTETAEEATSPQRPEDDLADTLLKADLFCAYVDAGFLANLYHSGIASSSKEGGLDETGLEVPEFAGPSFFCSDVDDDDVSYARITSNDLERLQRLFGQLLAKTVEAESGATMEDLCADSKTAADLNQSMQGLVDEQFLSAEGWIFAKSASEPTQTLKERFEDAGIRTETPEALNFCAL